MAPPIQWPKAAYVATTCGSSTGALLKCSQTFLMAHLSKVLSFQDNHLPFHLLFSYGFFLNFPPFSQLLQDSPLRGQSCRSPPGPISTYSAGHCLPFPTAFLPIVSLLTLFQLILFCSSETPLFFFLTLASSHSPVCVSSQSCSCGWFLRTLEASTCQPHPPRRIPHDPNEISISSVPSHYLISLFCFQFNTSQLPELTLFVYLVIGSVLSRK